MNDSIVSLNEMPLNEVKPFIIANVKSQCSLDTTARICIAGPPGCGKSDLMRQICRENGWGLSVQYLSSMSLEEITGIPCKVEDGDHAKFTKPEIFNFDCMDYCPDDYEIGKTTTILLIDDFHLADKVIQKYLFQLLTYRSIKNYKLPKNCAIVLAGNRMSDKALAHTIPAPIMNRLIVFEVKADHRDWLKNYAFSHNVRSDIASFISAKGDVYFTQAPLESMPWASPRSWTFLSDQMNAYEKIYGSIPISQLKKIANGLIGPDFAAEFIAYREIFAKWDIKKIVEKDDDELLRMFTSEIAKNSIAAYAIINSAFTWMIEETKKLGFDKDSPEVEKITRSTYEILKVILQVKCKGVYVKPLVIAGTSYVYMFYSAMSSSEMAEKFEGVLTLFLSNMKQKRDIDWLYYEIVAYAFGYQISEDDRKEIEKAKKRLGE